MPTPTETNKSAARPSLQARAAATIQAQPSTAARSPQPAIDANKDHLAKRFAAHRKHIPEMFLKYEPQPVSATCNNPVLDEHGAALFLGLSRELLKKWRQRGIGPDYIQYGKNGPIRYEVNELVEYRLCNRVRLRSAQ